MLKRITERLLHDAILSSVYKSSRDRRTLWEDSLKLPLQELILSHNKDREKNAEKNSLMFVASFATSCPNSYDLQTVWDTKDHLYTHSVVKKWSDFCCMWQKSSSYIHLEETIISMIIYPSRWRIDRVHYCFRCVLSVFDQARTEQILTLEKQNPRLLVFRPHPGSSSSSDLMFLLYRETIWWGKKRQWDLYF